MWERLWFLGVLKQGCLRYANPELKDYCSMSLSWFSYWERKKLQRSKLWGCRLFTIGQILLQIQRSNLSYSNKKYSCFHTAVVRSSISPFQVTSSYLVSSDRYMGAYTLFHHDKTPDRCYLAIAYSYVHSPVKNLSPASKSFWKSTGFN